MLLGGGRFTAQAQAKREPVPIPLGRTAPAPLPLTNLPPFESVYERKPSPAPTNPVPAQPEDRPAPVPVAPAATEPAAAAPKSLPAPVTPPAPLLSAEERKARSVLLTQILSLAVPQTQKYNQSFRDLSAEEIRVSERFDRKGETKQQRRIICDLVVYQSRLEPTLVYEYRSAKTVDGKAIKQDEKHLEKFFQKLLKAKTTKAELDLMNEEGFQYDLPLGGSFYGLTLFQWREILPFALADVGFEVPGREIVEGKETVVIFYRQLRVNPKLEWHLPKGLGLERGQQFVRGRLWLDAVTMQIWRGERELTLLLPGEKEVVPMWRQTMSYKTSPYGIFVPQKFVAEYLYFIERGKDGHLASTLSGRLTSEFGEFKRFDVTSEEQDKKTILKDEPKPPTSPPIRK